MERITGSVMSTVLRPAAHLLVHQRLVVVKRLLEALAALHEHTVAVQGWEGGKGLCHGDISYANVLVDTVQWRVLLCDFGTAAQLAQAVHGTRCFGTAKFSAPELLQSSATPTHASDVYSTGCVALSILCGEDVAPVSFVRTLRDQPRLIDDCFAQLHLNYLCDWMKRMLDVTADKRPSAREALRQFAALVGETVL